MGESPPPQLMGLLKRLGLSGSVPIGSLRSRVRRLARDLPRFESVWVDALAQARVITPWQATQINAGRGESLRIGPFVLCGPLPWPDYLPCYRARRIESGEPVRLAVVDNCGKRAGQIAGRLEALAAAGAALPSEHLAPLSEVGTEGDRIWAAAGWVDGRSAAEWMVHNGRFPPEVVLEIARAMLQGLVALEKAGLCHGDVSTGGLLLTDGGGVVLSQPGIRAILRPEEGYGNADLPPAAYDYLAPERVADGTPPETASDVYACGCVWWHLLCGRPPLTGGDSLAKLRAAQAAEVVDVRPLAPGVSAALAEAVSACVNPSPGARPRSMAELSAALGPCSRGGKAALAGCLTRPRRTVDRWATPAARFSGPGRLPAVLMGLAGCLVAAAAVLWPIWRAGLPVPVASINAETFYQKGTVPFSLRENRDSPLRENRDSPLRENRDSPQRENRGSPPRAASAERDQRPGPEKPDTPAEVAEDLVLATGGPLEIESLEIPPGQCVRGARGRRPLVMVPRAGLPVVAEEVRFEGIDFVWNHAASADHPSAASAAIVDLRSGRAEFHGCSFRSVAGRSSPQPAAIRWTHPAESGEGVSSLPSGRLQLRDCVLSRVDAAIDSRTTAALAVELTNTLHLGSGPLLRLDHLPRPDEPILVVLSQVTLRGGGGLLEARCRRIEGPPGEISIRAAGCAFVPGADAALLLLCGPKPPTEVLSDVLANVRWTGQGSLVSPAAAIAAWRGADGELEVLDDARVSIAGLVRSEVEFAGEAAANPAASRIVRWQAPLRSTDPPGIDPAELPAERALRGRMRTSAKQ